MSTLIGTTKTGGVVVASFVAYDQVPRPIAETLSTHYTDAKKVDELLALGALFFVAPEIGQKHDFYRGHIDHPEWTAAYSRDKGVESEPQFHADEKAFIEFAERNHYRQIFLYKNGQWHEFNVEKKFIPLKKAQ